MNKKSQWLILGSIISVGVAGLTTGIVFVVKDFNKFEKENDNSYTPLPPQKISYFHKEIDGYNFYFEQANWGNENKQEILFSHKIVTISDDAYIRKSDNKFFITPEKVLADIKKTPSTDKGFFPDNPVNGQTKISALIYYYADDPNMDPWELTYYDETVNGISLEEPGYFKSKPRFFWEPPFSKYAMYKVNEGEQIMYYGGVTNSVVLSNVYEKHAIRISNVVKPNGQRCYKFLDSVNTDNTIYDGKLGMSYDNIEYHETIPEYVSYNVSLIEKPEPTETPAYTVDVYFGYWSNVVATVKLIE